MKIRKIAVLLSLLLALCLLFAACDQASGDDTTAPAATTADPSATAAGTEDGEFFLYEISEFNGQRFCYVSGLTEAGKRQKTLDVPERVGDDAVTGFNNGCFAGASELETLTVHSSITDWGSALFKDCPKLTRVNMDYDALAKMAEENPLLTEDFGAATPFGGGLYDENSVVEGAPNVRFYFTSQAAYDLFDTHYSWGFYSDILIKE